MIIAIPFRGPRPNKSHGRIASRFGPWAALRWPFFVRSDRSQ